jgi:hypothetical protein
MPSMPEPKNRKKCAICGKPADEMFRPFCSKRCADVEHCTENAGVGGSIPPLGTMTFLHSFA